MVDETARLVQRATTGNELALEELFDNNMPLLRAFIRLRVGRRILVQESAEDLVQSVCREVLQDISVFEYRGPTSFRRWLCLSALRKIRDRDRFYQRERREAGREQALPDDPAAWSAYSSLVTPSKVAIGREDVVRFEEAFEKLPDDYKTVVSLSKLVGMSHAEIAEEMSKTTAATRVLLHRALARLGRLIDES